MRDDLVDLINEQGYIYQIVISSDKYTIDEIAGGVINPDNSMNIGVWSHHKSRLKKHQKHSAQDICFDDITAIYGYTENTKVIVNEKGEEEVEDNWELVWSAN